MRLKQPPTLTVGPNGHFLDLIFTLPEIRIRISTTEEVPYLGAQTFGENYEWVFP